MGLPGFHRNCRAPAACVVARLLRSHRPGILRNLHAAARDAYWRGVASSLEDGNQVVREIYADLAATNQQIKTLIANLQNAGALLSLVKQAVRLAGSLVTLAAA